VARVVSLQLHEAHGRPLRPIASAEVRIGGGLEGDSHAGRSKRAIVVVDRSTHDAVGVQPGDLREQITVEGLPRIERLAEGALLRVGLVTLRVNGPCEPCDHIGELVGVGDPLQFQAMLEGRRGVVCSVVSADGPLRIGDEVTVEEPAPV